MITALLALVIIALAVISFTSREVFSGYLHRQAQTQLTNYYNEIESRAQFGHQSNLFFNNGQEQVWLLNTSGGQFTDPTTGAPLSGTSTTQPPQIPTSQQWLSANSGKVVTAQAPSGTNWLVITDQVNVRGPFGPGTPAILVVGYDLGTLSQDLNYLTEIDLLVSAAVVLILAMVGVAVVRRSLRPLTDIEQTAAAIAGGDLSRRVPDRDPRTEVGRLGRSLNTMLAQIETAFQDRTRSEEAARQSEQRMRQFVADASHELRTPLTAIRGFAEYYRQRGGVADSSAAPAQPGAVNGAEEAAAVAAFPGSPPDAGAAQEVRGPLGRADLDRMMQRVEQESLRMGVLVEDMLLLARLDQQRPLEQRPVDLLTLAADAVGDTRVVAPDRTISLTVGGGVAPIVLGDEVRLRQVIGNLMNNAISHTPDGTPIEVRVRSGSLDEWRMTPPVTTVPAGWTAGPAQGAAPVVRQARTALAVAGMTRPDPVPAAVLEIADHGPGLTPEQAEHVFERFYRADQARTWKSGTGAGLGLAIVSALVAAHGGTVWVESPPGGGATFRIAIPLAPEARQGGTEFGDETEPGYDTGPGYYDEPGEFTELGDFRQSGDLRGPGDFREPEDFREPGDFTGPAGGTDADIIDSGWGATRWEG
jgi:two-component system OmpR family sensor kinase